MSPIEESLLKFLLDDTLRVAVLKGEWGIGKTFSGETFLIKRRKISVFGHTHMFHFSVLKKLAT